MLRSQSINNLNTNKTSSGFLRFLRSKKSENELTRTNLRTTTSSSSQRPLSISLSSFNISNILSLSKLLQIEDIDDDQSNKENNYRTLKTRSSVPILSSKSSNDAVINKRHSTIFQVSPSNSSSPQTTIQSQIDSIFDESDIIYVDTSEDDIISNTSSTNPIDKSTNINKMHRTINSNNLSDFINEIHDDKQDHGKITFDFNLSSELKDLESLNTYLKNQSNEFISRFSLVGNVLMMKTTNNVENINKNILDDDFLDALKLDDYIEEDLIFNI